ETRRFPSEIVRAREDALRFAAMRWRTPGRFRETIVGGARHVRRAERVRIVDLVADVVARRNQAELGSAVVVELAAVAEQLRAAIEIGSQRDGDGFVELLEHRHEWRKRRELAGVEGSVTALTPLLDRIAHRGDVARMRLALVRLRFVGERDRAIDRFARIVD